MNESSIQSSSAPLIYLSKVFDSMFAAATPWTRRLVASSLVVSSITAFLLPTNQHLWNRYISTPSIVHCDAPMSSNTAPHHLQERFQKGMFFVWLYTDSKTGQPTSWERYQVASQIGEEVQIEMATKFQESQAFITHHRMTVSLKEALEDEWRLVFEYKDPVTGWRLFGSGENVQAFEEKFDIFTMMQIQSSLRDIRTRRARINGQDTPLIQTKRHAYNDVWYGGPCSNETLLCGVAIQKDFKEHKFRLIQYGEDERVTDVRVDAPSLWYRFVNLIAMNQSWL